MEKITRWTVALLISLLWIAGCSVSHNLSDAEKSALVTEKDFANYAEKVSKENRGKFKKTAIYLNSSYQLEYQTDAKNARIYIYSTVGVEKSEAKARTMATSYKTGATMGFKFGDLQEEPIKLTNKIGQNESLSLLKYKGKPAGNLFATAIDKKAVLVLFTGVYFDNEQDFRQFIDGYIERVTNFQIDKS